MTDRGDRDAKRTAVGCLAGGALFAVVFVAVWLAAITLYGLIVEQWELVTVRREFGHGWAFVYAPLIALGAGLAAAFWTTRRLPALRVTLSIVTAGLVALFVGIVLFGLGGLL